MLARNSHPHASLSSGLPTVPRRGQNAPRILQVPHCPKLLIIIIDNPNIYPKYSFLGVLTCFSSSLISKKHQKTSYVPTSCSLKKTTGRNSIRPPQSWFHSPPSLPTLAGFPSAPAPSHAGAGRNGGSRGTSPHHQGETPGS